MMNFKVSGQTPFQINARSFAVSPSNETYTLCYSADGVNYTDWEDETSSGETLVVNNIAKSMFFYLKNNNSEVTICY